MKLIRPRSIILFEWLLIASALLGVIDIRLHNNRPYAMVMFLGLTIIFWFFIARRASNIARWLFVLGLLVGMVAFTMRYSEFRELGWSAVAMALGVAFLRIVGAALLFREDATVWFKHKGQVLNHRDVFS